MTSMTILCMARHPGPVAASYPYSDREVYITLEWNGQILRGHGTLSWLPNAKRWGLPTGMDNGWLDETFHGLPAEVLAIVESLASMDANTRSGTIKPKDSL